VAPGFAAKIGSCVTNTNCWGAEIVDMKTCGSDIIVNILNPKMVREVNSANSYSDCNLFTHRFSFRQQTYT